MRTKSYQILTDIGKEYPDSWVIRERKIFALQSGMDEEYFMIPSTVHVEKLHWKNINHFMNTHFLVKLILNWFWNVPKFQRSYLLWSFVWILAKCIYIVVLLYIMACNSVKPRTGYINLSCLIIRVPFIQYLVKSNLYITLLNHLPNYGKYLRICRIIIHNPRASYIHKHYSINP